MGIPIMMWAMLVAGYFRTIDARAKDPGIIGPQTEPVRPHEFPFFAALRYAGGFICGGTLIRKDVVLTAAHCVDEGTERPPYSNWSIELGRHWLQKDKNNRVQYMEVARIELYPFWNIPKFKNDVALIFLTEKVIINKYVQTMDSLAVFGQNEEIKESTRCFVTGYGYTDYGGDSRYPRIPFKFNANIGKYQQCKKIIKETEDFKEYTMNPRKDVCVFEKDGQSGCFGDSGSALFCDLEDNGKYVQYGVVSWGPNCRNRVSIFARVSYFHRWIKYKIAAYRREKM